MKRTFRNGVTEGPVGRRRRMEETVGTGRGNGCCVKDIGQVSPYTPTDRKRSLTGQDNTRNKRDWFR